MIYLEGASMPGTDEGLETVYTASYYKQRFKTSRE
jgi:hypothetical protein